MPDLDSLYVVQHVLSNIRGKIRKSLQGTRHDHKTETGPDISRIFLHEGNQLVIAIIPEAVNSVVGGEYAAGQVHVTFYKRVQAVPYHGLHQSSDERHINHWLDGRRVDQRSCTVRDID